MVIRDEPASGGDEVADQLAALKGQFPELHACIDLSRAARAASLATTMSGAEDFSPASEGGRGDSYRRAQRNPLTRMVGIQHLFNLIGPGDNARNFSRAHIVLDVLGGDGVLARAFQQLNPPASMPQILTSDLSPDMVAAALAYGLPAIHQPAQHLMLKDNCVDAVIIAYGVHHIPREDRLQVVQEAFRVLKPGGRLVLHDFEEGSPVARWFNEVVDPYSFTGHRCSHFTQEEIRGYLIQTGFTGVVCRHLYDPFIFYGNSQQQVKDDMADCLLNMYGLGKLLAHREYSQALTVIYALAEECFRYDYARIGLSDAFGAAHIRITGDDGNWSLEMPRVALVGLASKP